MSEQGKVGEVFVDVRLRVSEAEKERLRRDIGSATAGVSGGGGRGGSFTAVDAGVSAAARARAEQEMDRNERRYQRNYDAAMFSRFKEQDRNEARYQRNYDAAMFAQFKEQERAAARLAAETAKANAGGMLGRAYRVGQTNIMGTGMLMQFMFGGWEVATAFRNQALNETARGLTTDPLGAAIADYKLIQALQSGPLGSLVGFALNPTGSRGRMLSTAIASANAQDAFASGMGDFRAGGAGIAGSARMSGMTGAAAQAEKARQDAEKTSREVRDAASKQNELARAQIDVEKASLSASAGDRASDIANRRWRGRTYAASGMLMGQTPDNSFGDIMAAVTTEIRNADADRIGVFRTSLYDMINRETLKQIADVNTTLANNLKEIGRTAARSVEEASIGAAMSAAVRGKSVGGLVDVARRQADLDREQTMRDIAGMPLPFALAAMGAFAERERGYYGAISPQVDAIRAEQYALTNARRAAGFRPLSQVAGKMIGEADTEAALLAQGRSLDQALLGNNAAAAAENIVFQANMEASAPGTTFRQRELILQNARKQLAILQKGTIAPVSPALSNPFSAVPGGPLADVSAQEARLGERPGQDILVQRVTHLIGLVSDFKESVISFFSK